MKTPPWKWNEKHKHSHRSEFFLLGAKRLHASKHVELKKKKSRKINLKKSAVIRNKRVVSVGWTEAVNVTLLLNHLR